MLLIPASCRYEIMNTDRESPDSHANSHVLHSLYYCSRIQLKLQCDLSVLQLLIALGSKDAIQANITYSLSAVLDYSGVIYTLLTREMATVKMVAETAGPLKPDRLGKLNI